MDENILRFRVGIFVVIAGCILGILIFLHSEQGWSRQYTVYIKPTSAPGVKIDTPIRKYGILIGRVNEVTPEDGYVLLGLGINEDEKIYEHETISIGSESILGDAGIEILTMPKEERGPVVPDKFVLTKVVIRRDPYKMIVDLQPQVDRTLKAMQDAGRSVEEASDGIRHFTGTLQDVFRDDEGELKGLIAKFGETTEKANAALAKFDRIFENVLEVVEDPALKGKFKETLEETFKVFRKMQEGIDETRQTVRAFRTIPTDVNRSLGKIDALTNELNARAPNVLAQINSSLKKTDELIVQVKQFTNMLNGLDLENGTVGKLLNDSEIHDAILETVRNVEETSIKLEPLVNDLRVFADAIARNPGAIVKGAIRRGGDANYKGTAGRDGRLFK
jgi:phospholipid/cholesterol/gamma-HCH transport system substrate-binding protein